MLGVAVAWLTIGLYWWWMISWLRDGWCARDDLPDWRYWCEVALFNLLHGAGWGYLFKGWGIL